MRAFALFMMVQGHTIHSLLDVSYSNSDSIIYSTWILFRGITAPVFIFVSGFVFTFLLYKNPIEFRANPRIKKGIYRGVSLIVIGYLLRYPTINLFNLVNVSPSHWVTFFAVDALHLIGFGLLTIILFAYILNFLNLNPTIAFLLLSIIIFTLSPIVNSIEWSESANVFFVSYITSQFGSIFPLFPYLGYLFLGSIFGLFLNKNRKFFEERKNLISLLIISSITIALPLLIETQYSIILFSVGAILFILPTIRLIPIKHKSLSKTILSVSKNSLWIYTIHLIIIYGSPASIGLFQIVGKTQSAIISVIAAVTMVILMTIISLGIDKLRVTKFKNI
jgi:uncharacterized membrane protein